MINLVVGPHSIEEHLGIKKRADSDFQKYACVMSAPLMDLECWATGLLETSEVSF